MNINYYEWLKTLNDENYECAMDVVTKEELVEKAIKYFDDNEMFEKIVELDRDDFGSEEEFNEEEIREKKKYIDSLIEWKGKGQYCLASYYWNCPYISLTKGLLENELLNIDDFPIPLSLELLENPKKYIKEWKKEEGYKYVYLVSYNNINQSRYEIKYLVYSNNQLDDVFQVLLDKKDISLFNSSYFSEEIEEFDIDEFKSYIYQPSEVDTIVI